MPVDWTFEEIVLVCDAVVANGWRGLNHNDPRVPELSDLLRSMSPEHARESPTFRNVNGVTRKAGDCQTAHPAHEGVTTRGGHMTQHVVDAFVADPKAMHTLARGVRAVADEQPDSFVAHAFDVDIGVDEGTAYERRVLARERNQSIRRDKVAEARSAHGVVCCEVCTFDFEAVYGDRGRDFCEVHHRNPLSVAGPSRTKLGDLAVLCSNCHRMIHRRRPWITIEQLTVVVGRD